MKEKLDQNPPFSPKGTPSVSDMMPFTPEPKPFLLSRFKAALVPSQVPALDRKHVFDFEIGVRMIASIEVDGKAQYVHLSFGVNPTCRTIRSNDELVRISHQLAAEFIGLREPLDTELTAKAYHLFYEP